MSYTKAYREAHKEEIRAYHKAYYAANREKMLARMQARRDANPELYLEYNADHKDHYKAYREANKDKLREHLQRAYPPGSAYNSWRKMKERCLNPNHIAYRLYGGRGITICGRWINSYKNFLADMGERPAGKSLDRYPDNNGNYEPGNCRWATPEEQQHNRRRGYKRGPNKKRTN